MPGNKLAGRWTLRTEAVIGRESVEKLKNSTVAVFGIGGVGGFVCEALVRAGVGHIIIVDNDDVDVTDLNRQILAFVSTVGRAKVEVMTERLKDINPDIDIKSHSCFYMPDTSCEVDLSGCDHIVDAVDTITAKVEIAKQGRLLGVPVISSMGTGNKLDPCRLEVADISETSVCPLARAMRRKLRDEGIQHLKVVYSREEPITDACAKNSRTPGSVSFVPSAAGLIIAGEVVKKIIK